MTVNLKDIVVLLVALTKKRWRLGIARTKKKVTFPLKARKITISCVGKRLSNIIFLVNEINELLSRIKGCASLFYIVSNSWDPISHKHVLAHDFTLFRQLNFSNVKTKQCSLHVRSLRNP